VSKIEKIRQYTKKTGAPGGRYSLLTSDWLAIADMKSILEAVALTYNYGKAKGYRAAKNGK